MDIRRRPSSPRAAALRLAQHRGRTLVLASVVVVGAALAWSANAQTSATPPADDKRPREVAQMRLSSAQVQQAFQHIDSNRDGSLSRAEVGVFPRIERHFERIDSNRDGAISPSEFETALQQAS